MWCLKHVGISSCGLVLVVSMFGVVAGLASELAAQEAPTELGDSPGALRVYFECSRGGRACDQREFRTQIDWVNWMRDRRDAQVHVIVTNQTTGSGGRLYTLDFIGLGDLEGSDDRLGVTTLGTDVRDETVRAMTRVLAVGLGRYSVLAGAGAPFDLVGLEDSDLTDRLVTSDQVEDPWNFWVFEIDLSGDLSGETSRQNRSVRAGFEASRTTTTWKYSLDARGDWRRNEIELADTTIIDTRRDWDTEIEVAYALSEHWSLGGAAEVSAATRTNQDLSVLIGPALEFSVWPYEEAPRRSLRVRYDIGIQHFEYEEETIFGFTEETRAIEILEVSINQRQPWGNVFANATASHYFHDLSKYRVSTGGFLSFRVVRGLDLRVNGRISWIRDQLFLALEDISDEDILLQRRRLASSFDWGFGVGLSFQFGSIFNNVVNNRF